MKRQFIYVKDAMAITGKSDKYCYQLFKKIRAHFGKSAGENITFFEFCTYFKIPYDKLMEEFD
jgi:hypothetical protein